MYRIRLFDRTPFEITLRDFLLRKNRYTIPWSPLRFDGHNKDLEIPETCSFFHPNFAYGKTSLNPMLVSIITQNTI